MLLEKELCLLPLLPYITRMLVDGHNFNLKPRKCAKRTEEVKFGRLIVNSFTMLKQCTLAASMQKKEKTSSRYDIILYSEYLILFRGNILVSTKVVSV